MRIGNNKLVTHTAKEIHIGVHDQFGQFIVLVTNVDGREVAVSVPIDELIRATGAHAMQQAIQCGGLAQN